MAVGIRQRPQTAPAPKEGQTLAKRQDLLRVHSRKMAGVMLALIAAACVASFSTGVRTGLPSLAFDWLFGLQLLRAAVAFAIVAALVVLLLRGFGGLWPQRITTTSLEFPEAEEDVLEGTAEASHVMRELLGELRSRSGGPAG